MEVFGYRKLIAYQKGKEVVKRTYKLLKKFPSEELGYITAEDRMSIDELIREEARLLSGLQNSYKPSTDSTDFKQ